MVATNSAYLNIGNLINSLHQNQVSFVTTVLQILATIFTAYLAVRTAFKQIARQFEHKIIYEGWFDFQKKLYDFSHAFNEYIVLVLGTKYFIESETNPLVNKGNQRQHRFEKWQKFTDSFHKLQQAYISFLESFEIHEIIFISLLKMKKIFIKEWRKNVEDKNNDFMEKMFPEMYGQNDSSTKEELKELVNVHFYEVSEVSVYLEDFRIEMQNVTVGKVLNKKISKRLTNPGYKILTRKGLIIQKINYNKKIKLLFLKLVKKIRKFITKFKHS